MPLNVSSYDQRVIRLFGEALTYTDVTPDAVAQHLLGFWQNPDIQPDAGEEEITAHGPQVTVLKSDIPPPVLEARVTRAAMPDTLYAVKRFEIDEGGLVVLELEEVRNEQ